jgi:hypothetical protein
VRRLLSLKTELSHLHRYSESQQQGGHGASSQQQGQYRPEQDAAGQPGSQNYNVGGGAQYNEPSYGNSQSAARSRAVRGIF